jgi:hypothetical protein
MKFWYQAAADAVMLVHFAFIAFALLGALLLLKWPRLIWLHLPVLCWAIYIELTGAICPLTPLENHFRALAGESTYYGGFITHYLGPLIYPSGLTRGWQFFALAILLAVNLPVYWCRVRKAGKTGKTGRHRGRAGHD